MWWYACCPYGSALGVNQSHGAHLYPGESLEDSACRVPMVKKKNLFTIVAVDTGMEIWRWGGSGCGDGDGTDGDEEASIDR